MKNSAEEQLHYEFEASPEPGRSVGILPGVRWLRMPLPFKIGHINLWLLEDDEGWSVVDTGIYTERSRSHWEEVFSSQLEGRQVRRVFVTHMHPDHVGCAGWICASFDAPLWMCREEYLLCRVLVMDTGKPAPPEGVRFYAEAGFADKALERYQATFGQFGQVVAALPQSYRRLTDGMNVRIGAHEWRVIIGRGHSVEHACLFCPELNALISGDQILPTISSNVSVFPTEPAANPLADWLQSIDKFLERLPEDVLVLPSHGRPFRGAHTRLRQLRDEHLANLEALAELCRAPVAPVDAFETLFRSPINANNLIMATGESVAHLNHLLHAGRVRSWIDPQGVRRYQRFDA